jgi:hypothetical protein
MSALPFGEALAQIVNGLEQVGVPYFIGGSVATVLYGEIRSTHDVDIVVELQLQHVPPLVAALTDSLRPQASADSWNKRRFRRRIADVSLACLQHEDRDRDGLVRLAQHDEADDVLCAG